MNKVVLLTPTSTGSVNIQSANPFAIAAADDGFYQNSTDLTTMKNAVQVYIQAILQQMQIISPIYFKPVLSDPFNLVTLAGYSDPVVTAYLQNNTNLGPGADTRDYVSHCKMAPKDAGGVVDGDTCVYDTSNLFIVGKAICPSIPDMNTTGPSMMIGLRASSIIKHRLGLFA